MAAAAIDNVIRFPDATRDWAFGQDRARALRMARDYLTQQLRDGLRLLLPEIEEELLTRGDLADERARRNLYYGAHEILHRNADKIEGLLAAHWSRLFDESVRGDEQSPGHGQFEELQLVEFADMDEQLAGKAIANQLRNGCEDSLFGVGRRLAFMAGRGDATIPVADLIAAAWRATVAELGLSRPACLEVLQAVGRHALATLAPAIQTTNDYLVGRNVLPGLRRGYDRPSVARSRIADIENQDVFALLQRLVSHGTNVGDSRTVGIAADGALSSLGQGVSMASMALAMERVMNSLDALQGAMPQTSAIATTGQLREFRASDLGQSLGHLDAVTVDIVATLFDFIFDDPAIADPIKALIGRMQIAVLKVAMLDKSFFSSKAHPARRLLDGISRAAVRFGPTVAHGDPLYARVAEIIEHLQREFNQDTSLFDALCAELDAFLDTEEAAADQCAAKAAPLVAAQEEREMAVLAADNALAGWLALSLPAVVTDLLANEWRGMLMRRYLEGDNTAWSVAIDMIAELVASVQPHPDVRERRILAAKLPMLVKRIHDSLDASKVPDSRRLMLIDSLFSLHASVLRGNSPEVELMAVAVPAAAESEVTSEVFEVGDTTLDSISLVASAMLPANDDVRDIMTDVADLGRGDWVEFVNSDGGLQRYRLAWVSPQRGILLFTNPQSPRALSITPAALALQIQRGEAAVISAEPLFDRAMSRALESLQAA